MTVKAYAKVNVTLEVLKHRSDGYHEIMSVMQTIDLADVLTYKLDNEIKLTGANINDTGVSQNIIVNAARLIQDYSGCTQGALIEAVKNIPVAAGLGGGSSDAAATLIGLNKLWGLELSSEQLLVLASQLGSDVSFFIRGGTALVEGRGEKVTPLPSFPSSWIVIVKPAVAITNKTAQLYAGLNSSHYSGGDATRKLVTTLKNVDTIEYGFIFNVFESIADEFFPCLPDYRRYFKAAGASHVHLCGSGPALFTLIPEYDRAAQIHADLVSQGIETYLTSVVNI